MRETATERGPLLRELHVSRGNLRDTGNLRRGAAVMGGTASAALLLGKLPVAIALVGVAGVLIAAAWWRRGSRDVRTAKSDEVTREGLLLHQHGLLCMEGAEDHWIPWAGVRGVAIDEETLTVRLERGGLPPVTLEPRYADVTIEQLATMLAEAAKVPGPYDGSQSRKDDLQ